MWQDLLDAQASGRIAGAVAVRGSDYVGNGMSLLSLLAYSAMAKGARAFIPGDLDAPHTWTNPGDAGRLLVAAALDRTAYGRYWLVPSEPALSIRDLAGRAASLAGWGAPRLVSLPSIAVRAYGLFDKDAGATVEMAYQFERPFLLDTADTEAHFGRHVTPLDESLRQNLTDAGHAVLSTPTVGVTQ